MNLMRSSVLLHVAVASLAVTASHLVSAQPPSRPVPTNLTGIWLLDGATTSFSAEPAPPLTAWGQQRYAANKPTVGSNAALDANDPTLDCLPPGLPYILTIPTPFEIVELDDQLIQIFEYDHSIRRIYTDGRTPPEDLELTGMYQWLGYSVGQWDGDTLIVETTGFNDRSWLDRSGYPHSTELKVTERLRRADPETLEIDVTVEDPIAFRRPWHGRMSFRLRNGWALFEHICVSRDNGSADYFEYKERAWSPAD